MSNRWNRLVLFSLLAVLLIFGSSGSVFASGNSNQGKMPLEKARQVLEERLLDTPGIAGIAHLEETLEIIVFLENELPKGLIPGRFEGFSVKTEITGKFQARAIATAAPVAVDSLYAVSSERLNSVDPLVGGVSVSAYVAGQSWAGTLGMVTYDDKILSNAHVIAMDLQNNFLPLGTPVIQPGAYDGGILGIDRAGELYKYIPITFTRRAQNTADAAIATIDAGIPASHGEQFSETGNYTISGTTTVTEGDTVRKSGRTTGLTENQVYLTNASVTIDYGGGKAARFVDQIIIYQPFSGSGDSGSAVDKNGAFVGLVFAGSSSYSIVCKAAYIIEGLGISVEPTTPRILETIAVLPATASVVEGSSQQFTATGTYNDGTSADITTTVAWESSDSSVAAINSSGLATGVSPGSAEIKASSGIISGTASLTVNQAPVQPSLNVTITMSIATRTAGKNMFVWAVAAVSVELAGATVEGRWIEPVYSTVSGVADASGNVIFQSDSIKNPPSGTRFTFIVDKVTKDGVVYELTGPLTNSITW